MELFILLTLLISHIAAARPFYSKLCQNIIPTTVDFATISIILYFDFGIAVEALGFPDVENNYFTPLFQAEEYITIKAYLILLIAPWLFRLGGMITNKGNHGESQEFVARLSKPLSVFFYFFTTLIAILLAFLGYRNIVQFQSVWAGRAELTEAWGPLIILLYFPTYFLGFYARLKDAKAKLGLSFSIGLAIASIMSTFAIGQRNTILVPLLILVLFRGKISVQKLLIFVTVAIIAASAMLPIFKWQYSASDLSIGDLVVETIHSDFSRSGVLTTALENTEAVGTKILPYPLAGYVYALLYYVPRSLVPFKGFSTAQYFTSHIVRTPVDDTNWGFGVGVIEEILLNAGWLWCIPGLILYGLCMGQLDKLSTVMPSLVVPSRLAATWLCGYDMPSLLITFGTMIVICWIFHHIFVEQKIEVVVVPQYEILTIQYKKN